MNAALPDLLKAALSRPLPCPMIDSRFAPRLGLGRQDPSIPPDARPAAVLILLYPREDHWCVPLTLRTEHLAAHAGQVSLPGGAVAPGESSQAAALREFQEELGPVDEPIHVLGPLSPVYVRASNFVVEPWVAAAACRPAMVPNRAEVAELLEIPLRHLLDPANFGSHVREFQNTRYEAPHFLWPPHRIWGATCMILGEFVTVLEMIQVENP